MSFLAAARGMLAPFGTLTLRRPGAPPVDVTVRARVRGYTPEELTGDVIQGDRRVIVLAEDVTFDPPLRRGDKVMAHGKMLNIENVDDSTGRLGSEGLVLYYLQARG